MSTHTGSERPSIDTLSEAYQRENQNVSAVARELGVSREWAHDLLVEADIHEPETPAHKRLEALDADELGGSEQ